MLSALFPLFWLLAKALFTLGVFLYALGVFPALGVLAEAFFSLLVALGVHPWQRFRRGAGRSHFSNDPYSSSCSTLGFFLYALGVFFTLNVFLYTLSVLTALGVLAEAIFILGLFLCARG